MEACRRLFRATVLLVESKETGTGTGIYVYVCIYIHIHTCTLQVSLSVYDAFAVLTPFGPLKALVELSEVFVATYAIIRPIHAMYTPCIRVYTPGVHTCVYMYIYIMYMPYVPREGGCLSPLC